MTTFLTSHFFLKACYIHCWNGNFIFFIYVQFFCIFLAFALWNQINFKTFVITLCFYTICLYFVFHFLKTNFKKTSHLLILQLLFLFDQVPWDVLFGHAWNLPINANWVDMFASEGRAEDILGEKVVLSCDNLIVLKVHNLLWKVFAFAIWVQTEVGGVVSTIVDPLFRRKVLIYRSEWIF